MYRYLHDQVDPYGKYAKVTKATTETLSAMASLGLGPGGLDVGGSRSHQDCRHSHGSRGVLPFWRVPLSPFSDAFPSASAHETGPRSDEDGPPWLPPQRPLGSKAGAW